MKKLPKILTIIFLSLFILQMLGLLIFLTIPQKIQAIEFTPQVSIGNDVKAGVAEPITGTSIGEYIMAIYKYAIGVVGILATVVLMYGGIRWLTSGGSSEKIGDAKSWIGAALSGLVLMLASFLILATINPKLVEIQSITPEIIGEAPTVNIKNLDSDGWYYSWALLPFETGENGSYATITECEEARKITSNQFDYIANVPCYEKFKADNVYMGCCKWIYKEDTLCTKNKTRRTCDVLQGAWTRDPECANCK